MSYSDTNTLKRPRAASCRAFTLLEVLVAVFSLSIITVGLVVILDSVQTTVRNGRQVSKVTNYASAIQRQLSRDISHITRDGFLVIVNQKANGASVVPMYAGQPTPEQRDRRIDELLFFARGDGSTGFREPIHEELVASAEAARIYYGHGQRGRTTASNYANPNLNDLNNDATSILGYNSPGIPPNPNLYANTWTLLRHETMLVEHSLVRNVLPVETMSTFGISSPDVTYDSRFQIRGRPAVSSVFNRLGDVTPNTVPLHIRGTVRPVFASGIVDTAATSLDEIRAVVTTVGAYPWAINDENDYAAALGGSGFSSTDLEYQQIWMREAIPTRVTPPASSIAARGVQVRMRYEDAPPDLVGVLSLPTAFDQANGRSDQMALAATRFLPNCSEFIVEWSFGDVYPNPTQNGTPPVDTRLEGRQVWHGLQRFDMSTPPMLVATPYSDSGSNIGSSGNELTEYRVAYELAVPTGPSLRGRFGEYEVPSRLVHGDRDPDPGQNAGRAELVSYFGYVNPEFNESDALSRSQPWPWPKQLRITVNIADPDRPGYEDTLQFVFDIPEESSSSR